MIIQFIDQYEEKFLDKHWPEIKKMEKLHPKQLAWAPADKKFYFEIEQGNALWMTIDGVLVGEVLWEPTKNDKIVYICSNSVKESHQNRGFSKLMKLVLYSLLKQKGYEEVRGHAKSGKSWHISKKMGGKLVKKIENYWETGETYYYYKQKL